MILFKWVKAQKYQCTLSKLVHKFLAKGKFPQLKLGLTIGLFFFFFVHVFIKMIFGLEDRLNERSLFWFQYSKSAICAGWLSSRTGPLGLIFLFLFYFFFPNLPHVVILSNLYPIKSPSFDFKIHLYRLCQAYFFMCKI